MKRNREARRQATLLRMIYAEAYAALYDYDMHPTAKEAVLRIADLVDREHGRLTGRTVVENAVDLAYKPFEAERQAGGGDGLKYPLDNTGVSLVHYTHE